MNNNAAIAMLEAAVLSAALRSPSAFAEVRERVQANDFESHAHQVIYNALCEVAEGHGAGTGPKPSVTAVAQKLMQQNLLEAAGGVAAISSIYGNATPLADIQFNVEAVVKASQHRMLVQLLTQGAENARRSGGAFNAADAILSIRGDLEALAQRGGRRMEFKQIGEYAEATIDALELEGVDAISTGYVDLDTVVGGVASERFVVVGARPGVGKTVLLANVATNVAKQGHPVLFVSLEMSAVEMFARLIAAECRINSRKLNLARPQLDDEDWRRLQAGLPRLLELKLFISEEPAVTAEALENTVAKFVSNFPDTKMVALDYLQLMGTARSVDNRQQEVSVLSRTCKTIAMKNKVALWAASQLNRGSTQKSDGRPTLTDLRESGSIEQDADQVILLDRPEMREPETPRAGEVDLDVAKNRQGPTQTIVLAALMNYYRFESLAA